MTSVMLCTVFNGQFAAACAFALIALLPAWGDHCVGLCSITLEAPSRCTIEYDDFPLRLAKRNELARGCYPDMIGYPDLGLARSLQYWAMGEPMRQRIESNRW